MTTEEEAKLRAQIENLTQMSVQIMSQNVLLQATADTILESLVSLYVGLGNPLPDMQRQIEEKLQSNLEKRMNSAAAALDRPLPVYTDAESPPQSEH